MAQSLSKLYIHLIFHIKNNHVKIRIADKNDLYAYMGSIIKDNDSIPILINGTDDHVHVLCIMSKNIALAKLVEEVKRHSSRWIKKKGGSYYSTFAWQGGYGAFTISPTLHGKTLRYIKNQEHHHKKMTFQEEYLMFLTEYKVDYDEKYLWTD